ncbi:spore photoproduct lyase [Caloranaerobacter azorensis DSM 13643]|uniref:Spore photoproduct lyase n=1 Tax=Caloranaerobacter azorensis DSM 13643 TaxID=1121264 RepID=A0A1M5W8E4_9FIRM|nr:radical SAM protein [Caloranaerobacter azorensis]SHH83741.1 spore photoproduct lyase [Caloranaerobacter azorensis DSM 13643]
MKVKESSKNSLVNFMNSFSHIYVEKEVLNHRITLEILSKFPNSKIIEIKNYKDVFNRPKQNFIIQKKSPKLILAKKIDNYLYEGSPICEDFGETSFYYSSNIFNCIYDCEYCYLRGLYSSSNIVIFVNIEDFFEEIIKTTKDRRAYICISYDSDILAFENITGFVRKWIEFANRNKNLLIEIRTKSSNFRSIKNLEIPSNIIFAWTLSPQKIIDDFEHKTPSLTARLNDIKVAISKGLKVRISLEPIIKVKGFESIYGEFIDEVFTEIPSDAVRDVNIGVFRMSEEHIKRLRRLDKYSKVFGYDFKKENGVVSYFDEEYLKSFVKERLINYIDEKKIY